MVKKWQEKIDKKISQISSEEWDQLAEQLNGIFKKISVDYKKKKKQNRLAWHTEGNKPFGPADGGRVWPHAR